MKIALSTWTYWKKLGLAPERVRSVHRINDDPPETQTWVEGKWVTVPGTSLGEPRSGPPPRKDHRKAMIWTYWQRWGTPEPLHIVAVYRESAAGEFQTWTEHGWVTIPAEFVGTAVHEGDPMWDRFQAYPLD